ncbi:MAG: hypothetical protein EA347_09485 [Thioalkalivibrio sp.]|nr:MAG: hypothetical protein EA347_09485 [Thioalkalivibrio sp.]
MTQNSILRRFGLAGLLGCGLVAFGPVHAIDFGDMMSPERMMSPDRWFGGTDRDRGQRDPDYGPRYGEPPRGAEPHAEQPFAQQQWGQQPFGQQPFGQQQWGQQPWGQQPWGQPPPGAVPFEQPAPPMERMPEWTDPRAPEPAPRAPGMDYGYPDYGAPGPQWRPPPVPDERMQQRMRELEQRIEELERRRPEPRRSPPMEPRQPQFPEADPDRPEFPPLEREQRGYPSFDR